MKINLILVWFGIVLVIVGIFGLGWSVTRADGAEMAPELDTPRVVLVSASPSPTAGMMLARVTPSATPDFPLATARAFYATETERVLQVNREVAANLAVAARVEQTRLSVEQTRLSVEQTGIAATQTQAGPASTATVAAQGTETMLLISRWTATASSPTLVYAEAQSRAYAETATPLAWGQVFATWAVGLVALVFAGVAVGVLRRAPAPVEQVTRVTHIEHEPGQVVRVPEPPCTDEQFRIWAVAALAGRSLAVNEWERAGSGFVGREYRQLYAWAVRYGMLARSAQGVTTLSERGERFCGHWLVENPLPHPGEGVENGGGGGHANGIMGMDAVGEGLK